MTREKIYRIQYTLRYSKNPRLYLNSVSLITLGEKKENLSFYTLNIRSPLDEQIFSIKIPIDSFPFLFPSTVPPCSLFLHPYLSNEVHYRIKRGEGKREGRSAITADPSSNSFSRRGKKVLRRQTFNNFNEPP